MNAIILSIGDELILGQTVDTNSAWLALQLASIGIPCIEHTTVPDDQSAIERAIADSASRCTLLFVTGGIGPTPDDLTRQALAAVLQDPLEQNPEARATLDAFFARLNRPMPPSNLIQAMIPKGARALPNPNGTAAGIHAMLSKSDGRPATSIFVLPGVPREMKSMFTQSVLPILQSSHTGAVILSRTLHTFGLGESTIAEKLGVLMDRHRNPSVGTTVADGLVSLRLNARFPSHPEALAQLDSTAAECHTALGPLIFGADTQTLPEAVAHLLLHPSPRSVTCAESCTGGLLSKLLTDLPGSSAYFKQSWITYSNAAKRDRLGVSENLLNSHGAVSEPVVIAMAANARRLAKADFALAISGVAGPSGGTEFKPVGTVCIALASDAPAPAGDAYRPRDERFFSSTTVARTFLFTGDRHAIRDRSAKMALTVLRYHLLNQPLQF